MELQDFEGDNIAKRRRQSITIGQMYVRMYDIPVGATGLIPARGDAVTLRDVELTQTGLYQPRVQKVEPGVTTKAAHRRIIVTFVQVQAYA